MLSLKSLIRNSGPLALARLFLPTILLMANLVVSSSVSASSENISLSSEEAIAKLSLKQISYSQHQSDYLTAITDLLVAEQKGIWNNLPSLNGEVDQSLFGDSSVPVPLKQNLTLIEASLYHYFGMEKEAEGRYQSVISDKSAHLPTAFLLLARYYHELKDYKNVLVWTNKVDRDSLLDDQKDILDFYTLNALIKTSKKEKAIQLLTQLDEPEWLPVLSYNARRMFPLGSQKSESDWSKNITLEDVTPLLSELYAHQTIQLGVDAIDKGLWSNAVELFSSVPEGTLRSNEAQRWLAWALLKNEETHKSYAIWSGLTEAPAHQALDAFAMTATTVEQLGEKANALVWFQRSVEFYEQQVVYLESLRKKVSDGKWFSSIVTSGESFWAPVYIEIPHEDDLYIWTADVWSTGEFQQLLADYRDLTQMTRLLESKSEYAQLFGYMVDNREQAYKNTQIKITRMDAAKKLSDYRKQLKVYQNKLEETSDYKDVFSVGDKKQLLNRALLEKIKKNIDALKSMQGYARKHRTNSYEERYKHLERIYLWEMSEAFPSNFRKFERQVNSFSEQLSNSNKALDKMQSAQASAPIRFKGYSSKIRVMDQRLSSAIKQSQKLQSKLKTRVLSILEKALVKKQGVAQNYLEQTLLASARLQDELAFDLTAVNQVNGEGSTGDKK